MAINQITARDKEYIGAFIIQSVKSKSAGLELACIDAIECILHYAALKCKKNDVRFIHHRAMEEFKSNTQKNGEEFCHPQIQ